MLAGPGVVAPTDLDLHQLRVFVAVAQSRSFTEAAARLQTSQPSISRAISRLERSLGTRLIDRTTHSCALAKAGSVLLPRACEVLRSVELTVHLTRRSAAPVRRLIVALKPDSDAGLLPEILRGCEDDPACSPIELLFRETHELGPAVRAGTADVALVVGPCDLEGLDVEELWHEQRVAILPTRHLLAERAKLTVTDFDDQPVIAWPAAPTTLDRYYRGADLRPPDDPGPTGPAPATLAEAVRLVWRHDSRDADVRGFSQAALRAAGIR